MGHCNNNFCAAAFTALLAFFGLAACTRTSPSHQQTSQSQAPGAVSAIGIDATEAQIQHAVASVRVGQKLTPKQWPNGALVAVCLSFDVDNEALWRENPLPVPLSEGVRRHDRSPAHPRASRPRASAGFLLYPRHERHAASANDSRHHKERTSRDRSPWLGA